MLRIHFVFVGEGPTDNGLVPHLEALCVRAGASEVSGVVPDFRLLPLHVGHTVHNKAAAALRLEPSANLLFVHRDADSRDPSPRYLEIERELASISGVPLHVSVVPVQEVEAWLLLDETPIRRVAENPRGTTPLLIPSSMNVENIASPKEQLMALLTQANGASGRRLRKFREAFPRHRRRLLESLNIDGPLVSVPSWQRLVQDIEEAVRSLSRNTV